MQARRNRQSVSLITLGLIFGAENGADLARDIRKDRSVPLIVPTGKGDFIDRAVDLEVGADGDPGDVVSAV
jgi:DNA-binding response OmpR family regulator